MALKKFFITTVVWLVVVITMPTIFVFFALLWILSFPFDKKHYFTQKLTWMWCTFYVKIYPFWTVQLIDVHKLKRGRGQIAVSNHQSMLDIIFLFHAYAYFVWVSKIENFKTPVLGWVMYINHYISLQRNDPRTFPKMFEGIQKALKQDKTVMIFPEGTRSLTTQLGRFKEGAFKAAIDNKVSIVPIVLDGTGKILPKEGMVIKEKTKIVIKVLDEIKYEDFPSYDPTILKEYVKGIIATELEKIRQ